MNEYILVVDDEPDIRLAIGDALQASGFEVATAEDGLTALVMVSERMPDLIILDLMMPTIDGVETLERLRKSSDVPVIICSAVGDIRIKDLTGRHQISGQITKPFMIENVLRMVYKALG
jgi:two-component system KDP operon response regulator KdpE